MSNYSESRTPLPRADVLKMCPWCGGSLVFEPYYPVMRLIPGDSPKFRGEDLPPTLRTVPAWVCETAHCKYREKA
jgi:hypothetical protein